MTIYLYYKCKRGPPPTPPPIPNKNGLLTSNRNGCSLKLSSILKWFGIEILSLELTNWFNVDTKGSKLTKALKTTLSVIARPYEFKTETLGSKLKPGFKIETLGSKLKHGFKIETLALN